MQHPFHFVIVKLVPCWYSLSFTYQELAILSTYHRKYLCYMYIQHLLEVTAYQRYTY